MMLGPYLTRTRATQVAQQYKNKGGYIVRIQEPNRIATSDYYVYVEKKIHHSLLNLKSRGKL